jgi:uncharacterized protein (UPF0248 family)
MNPIRELLNKWRYNGKAGLSIRINNHTDHGTIVEGTDIQDINPNGFTTYDSDFEIPYHRVLIILEEQTDGSWQNLYTKRQSWKG